MAPTTAAAADGRDPGRRPPGGRRRRPPPRRPIRGGSGFPSILPNSLRPILAVLLAAAAGFRRTPRDSPALGGPFGGPPLPAIPVASAAAPDASDAAEDLPLTEEEIEIIDRIRAIAAAAPPPPGDAALPESLAEVRDAVQERIVALRESASRGEELAVEVESLAERRAALAERTGGLERAVRRHNEAQLGGLLERLNGTLGDELRRRNALDAAIAERDRRAEIRREAGGRDQITVERLEEELDAGAIMRGSEAELEGWVVSLAKKELDTAKEAERAKLEELKRKREERSKCVTPLEAGEMVQSDLARHAADGTGRVDHVSLQRGGSMVYDDGMTSEAYNPDRREGRDRNMIMGKVWWRRYIPEDWEELLPEGWQYWSVPQNLDGFIPSYVKNSVKRVLGPKGTTTQPADAVLNPNTNVGSCFPMSGRSGRVTVRLPYSLKIDAVTLEHIPAVLGGERGRSSAPRYFSVVGYPPCPAEVPGEEKTEEERECDRRGFDSATSFDLGSYEYRLISGKLDKDGNAIGGRSIQTFDVSDALSKAVREAAALISAGDHDDDDEEEDDGDDDDSGMCTTEKAAKCGGPSPDGDDVAMGSAVRAVALIVEDNWGTEEYTCLYRFRVHGERIAE